MNKTDVKKRIKNTDVLKEDSQDDLINLFYNYDDTDTRILIIKKLGRLKGNDLVGFFHKIVRNNQSEKVRKEAVSSIGRRRDIDIAKDILVSYLNDYNPEIILQAIRGLLVFKNDPDIIKILKDTYKNTDNEIIKNIISIEYKLEKLDFDTKKDHPYVDKRLKNKVINSDVLKVMNLIENNSVHLTFTSPPYYNARDYSTYSSYNEYLSFLEEVFNEVHRITKDGRFLIVNTSPVIVPRVGRKYSSTRYPIPYDLNTILTNNGWEFIDDIHWVKPDASVKNRIGGFTQFRKPLMYKPNGVTEQIMVYRKKSNRLIDWNIRAYPDEVVKESLVEGEYDRVNTWNIDPVSDKTHSAVFPYELCKKIVKYYSFANDLIFDPFAGSGTLAKAALDLKRNIFMTEISTEYYDRIQERLLNYFEISYGNYDSFKKNMKESSK